MKDSSLTTASQRSDIQDLEHSGVKRKGYLQLSFLVLASFYSAFYPRVLLIIKFPSIVNLVHLGIVPFVCLVAILKTKAKSRKQVAIAQELLFALFVFFTVQIASALLNGAGVINAFVNFLLLCEHFLFLLAIVCVPMTPKKFKNLRAHIVAASFINTLFAYVQRYALKLHLRKGLEDNIKGVFIAQGAGHVVGASVALTFGIYYFGAAKKMPIWFRVVVAIATFWHMNMADAKQVLLAFGIGAILFVLSKLKNVVEALKVLIGASTFGSLFYWAVFIAELPGFEAFKTWARPEMYGPEGEATLLKSATFRIVPTFYESYLHPLLGLGPGHTVGRLGGWMLREYEDLLNPLGATSHPATGAIWGAVGDSWLGDQSSMFSPLFGWAGIWGDSGWIGLISFLYIWFVVWHRLCVDDIAKYMALTPLAFGLIFSQMEEPGYMLYVAGIIGLSWQEHHCSKMGMVDNESASLQTKKKPRSRLMKRLHQLLLLE